jgi:hypothetical protein
MAQACGRFRVRVAVRRVLSVRVDFHAARATPRAGIALLAVAVLACAGLAGRAWMVHAEASGIGERVADARDGGRGAARRPLLQPSAETRDEIRRAQLLVKRLGAPWSDLFDTVESSADGRVALLSIQPDAQTGTVRISAEAKDIASALAFADRLSGDGKLAGLHLTEHEVRRQDPQRPVRVTFVGQWGGDRP